MADLNGHDQPVLDASQQACVKLLETALAQAKAGQVATVGIVLCGPGGFQPAMAGPQAPELNIGLDALKQQILGAVMMASAQAASRRPHVLRPGFRG